MPVVAVGLAAWSVAGAASVGFAALGAFEIIGVAGAVIGAVGAVTKNKTLMKIGMIAGVVGAVGSFATSAGIFKDPLGHVGKGVTEFQSKMSFGAVEANPANVGGLEKAADMATIKSAIDASGKTFINTTSLEAGSSLSSGAAVSGTAATELAAKVAAEAAAPAAGTGLMDTFKAFAKDNPTIAYAGLTTLGNAVSGAFDPSVGPNIGKTNAETAKATAEAATIEQQRLNMQAPLPTLKPGQMPLTAPTQTAGANYPTDPGTGLPAPPPGLLNRRAVTGENYA